MFDVFTDNMPHLIAIYGYWVVLFFVAVESSGIPFPGESMLIAAAIYAGIHQDFHILFVILAAAAGAVLGDNIGFLVGRKGGYRLLRRYGHIVRLDERKLKLGIYLFSRHGGKMVFFGRFVAVLRAWAAFLAGTFHMSWNRFLFFNAAGGFFWATLVGLGGYALGSNIHRVTGPIGIVSVIVAILVVVGAFVALHLYEERLAEEAERMMPGPLDDWYPKNGSATRRIPVIPG